MEIFSLVGKIVLDGQKEVERSLKSIDANSKQLAATFKAVGVDTSGVAASLAANLDTSIGGTLGGLGGSIEAWGKNAGATLKGVSDKLIPIGAGLAGMGGAGLKAVDDAREVNTGLAMTAATMGVNAKDLQDAAKEVSGVSFPMKEVLPTFDYLARAGVTEIKRMQDTAKVMDAVGDATKMNADAVAAALVPAYKAFGMALPTTVGQMDNLTWLARTSTVDLTDFGTTIERSAPLMQGLNITMDDAVAILAAYSAKGIQGRSAIMMFRAGLDQMADGSTTLNAAMGLTNEETDGHDSPGAALTRT